jgi:hypothetical protein
MRSVEFTSIWPDDAAFRRGWLGNPVYIASRSDRSATLLNALNADMITTMKEKAPSAHSRQSHSADGSPEYLHQQRAVLGKKDRYRRRKRSRPQCVDAHRRTDDL